jgi:hypothetical protein
MTPGESVTARLSGAFETIAGSRKAPREPQRRTRMLTLPQRGDVIANRLWWCGVIAYALLAVVLYGSLAVTNGGLMMALRSIAGYSGDHFNYAVLVLVASGFLLTIWAAIYLRGDIGQIRQEEIDIDWVDKHKTEGLPYVFEDPAKREALFAGGAHLDGSYFPEVTVETLIDDRVRRTHMVSDSGGRASSEELRIIADRRTARWGAVARYVSSLLLLLAVLGTFAGVKTALPPLIAAVGQSNGDTMSALQAPLEAVASAFGGNALALIGAIAVGLMAQGIAFGRRNLLERLELVSTEYIYSDSVASSSDPMQAALEMFKVSSKDFKDAAGAISGLETGLEHLGNQFSSSFSDLGERLAEIAARNGDEMFDKTARNLSVLQSRVGELADAVYSNAQVYAGLAPSLQYRAEETRAALSEMEKTNRQLTTAMEVISAASQSATDMTKQASAALDHVQQASTRIAAASEQTEQNVALLSQAISQVQPRVESVDYSLGQIASAATQSDKRLAEMWQGFAERIEKRLAVRDESIPPFRYPQTQSKVSEVNEPSRAASSQPDDLSRILRQIHETLREAPKPRIPHPLWFIAGPVASVLVSAGVAFWLLRGR